MRTPDHQRAEEWAEENECPNCGNEDLIVNKIGAYIDCAECAWIGFAYEAIGALS